MSSRTGWGLLAACILLPGCTDRPLPTEQAPDVPPSFAAAENEWGSFNSVWWACDEAVAIDVRWHFTWSWTETDNRWHAQEHLNAIGSGRGLTSDRAYRYQEHYQWIENSSTEPGFPFTTTHVSGLRLIGLGTAADLQATWHWHITVNANGEVTAYVDDATFTCRYHPGPIVVNVVDDVDDGACTEQHCSLREAINAANAREGRDSIAFRIPGPAPHTIQPTSALPPLWDPVIIDGTTEPGYQGTPIVELDGTNAGPGHGLTIMGGFSVVRGLAINGFGATDYFNGVDLNEGGWNVIEGNYIGTDLTGTVAKGNSNAGVMINSPNNRIGGITPEARNVISGNLEGVTIADPRAVQNVVIGNYIGTAANGVDALGNVVGVLVLADENRIGGAAPGAGNVISGNTGNGIGIEWAFGTVVRGNYIGTDVTGTQPLGNGDRGVSISGASETVVGGESPAARNVISANASGVLLDNGAFGNRVVGNYFGTDVTGTANLGNVASGVFLRTGASDNRIGGTSPALANVVAFSGRAAIFVHPTAGTGNAILGNAVFESGGLGIDIGPGGVTPNDPWDLDTGANELQNFPVLFSATSDGGLTVDGSLHSLPITAFRIEFFASTVCDPSGHGEGETFLGYTDVTTDGMGDAPFTATLPGSVPAGMAVTATATDPFGNTSEFSSCVTAM